MIFNDNNTDKSFQKINLLHLASLIFQIILLIIIYVLTHKKSSFQISDQPTIIYIQYVFIVLGLAAIPLSEHLLKQKLRKVLLVSDKKERLESYLIFIIMKLALIEFINIFSIVIYYLTGNITFLYISVILIIFFLISRPGKEKIMNDLGL